MTVFFNFDLFKNFDFSIYLLFEMTVFGNVSNNFFKSSSDVENVQRSFNYCINRMLYWVPMQD
jgi:hypothetical protein